MGILQMVGSVFLVAGWVFALTGSIGVVRLPDFYSRLHPAGKTDSFAQGLIVIGLCFFALQELIPAAAMPGQRPPEGPDFLATVGTLDVVLKLILLVALIFVTSPTATHAISKAARGDKFTRIAVDGDHGDDQRIGDLVVAGDTDALLEDRPSGVFNVDEDDEPNPDPKGDV